MLTKQSLYVLSVYLLLILAAGSLAQTKPPVGPVLEVASTPARIGMQPEPTATPAPNQMLHLTFALNSARRAGLEAYVETLHDRHSPNYRHWLTPQQVGQRFGATDADLQEVVSYARSQGFQVTHVWPNHLFVSANATVAQAERAFGVRIGGYLRPAAMTRKGDPPTFYAPDRHPRLAASIASRLKGIFGLSDMLRLHSSQSHPPAGNGMLPMHPGNGAPGGPPSFPMFTSPLGPPQISTVYNLDPLHNSGFQGDGMTIGIFSPTLVDLSDFAYFAVYYGLSGFHITEVPVDGGATDFNGDGEANMDMDIILGQAPHATVTLYESPNDGNLDVWNQIETDNLPILSDSWGIPESNLGGFQSYVDSLETILAAMDAQNQAHFNSSGDAGANDVIYPGSSPHVTSVGGTALPTDNNGHWASETGWSGSGGGLSVFFAQPSWQAGPGVVNSYSNGMRQTPDIAAMGDPATPGYWIYYHGRWVQAAGTSATAPLWAGANVIIDQAANTRLGNLNPQLYWIGTNLNDVSDIFVYHDITIGNNGFPCTAKWDFVTGWGSADFYKLYADLALLPNLAPFNPGGAWTSPLMIHANAGDVTEPAFFDDATTYYFAASIGNYGPADAVADVESIRIDGVDHPFSQGALAADYYLPNLTAYATTLTAGTHTIELVADVLNQLQENNKNDNLFVRQVVVRPRLVSVTVNPTAVFGSQPVTGTVTLSGAAPAGGAVVTLTSSDTTAATVPASVTVAAGATTATITITTRAVTQVKNVTISGTYNAVTQTAALAVNPLQVLSLTLAPATVTGGSPSTGTVTLNGPAPNTNITTVQLTSSAGTVARVQGGVVVRAGTTSATFTINTFSVANSTNVTISASYGGATVPATLTVNPPTLASLTLAPATVTGGSRSTGTVTLNAPAPTGGAVVTLGKTGNIATVPATVTIMAGARSATFTVDTIPVAQTLTCSIIGFYGVGQRATLTVNPPALTSLSLNPATVLGSRPSTGTVTLDGPAPAGGAVVTLTSNNAAATVPATVTIAAGARSATFTVTTTAVAAVTRVTIGGTFGGVSRSATLTIDPPTLITLSLNPTGVKGGTFSTGTVTLNGPAPAGGAVVTLASNQAFATVPANVTIAAGATSATFRVTTAAVNVSRNATITASFGGVTKTAVLIVTK